MCNRYQFYLPLIQKLSPRATTAVALIRAGHCPNAAARIMGIRPQTIRIMLKRIAKTGSAAWEKE